MRIRRTGRVVAAALTWFLLAICAPIVAAPPAGAAEPTTMTFHGRGWGHGRGMSQYGAQGYAKNLGWDHTKILGHYYGGTVMGTAPDQIMRIKLVYQDGRSTVVASDGGTVRLQGNNGYAAGGFGAVRLTKLADGTIRAEQATGCGGPWTAVANTGAQHVSVHRLTGSQPLRLCREDGVHIWYPGTLEAVVSGGVQRTINTTSIESALRSIVPSESPSSWHEEALRAQSVAARSYALSPDSRFLPYADTCDTTLCQVYNGWFRGSATTKTATTAASTDQALSATAGKVRRKGSLTGAIARTEFHSTSGGWTAGGEFPAVKDDGDSISPLHTWTTTVPVTTLETWKGQGAKLLRIEVLKRNGLGADGGRVLTARLHFSNGVRSDVTGDDIRSKLGLRSNWFSPACDAERRYIEDVFQLFLGRQPTAAEVEARCPAVRTRDLLSVTQGLARSDEWAGRQIDLLYQKVFERPADVEGRAYWLQRVQAGMRVEDIAALLYGSKEYYVDAGSTHGGYVDALYLDILGRRSDPEGREHWAGQLSSGRLSRTDVAGSFYASLESRRDRVRSLYQQVLGRPADDAGLEHWTRELLRLGDVALAAHLAASEEYYERATPT